MKKTLITLSLLASASTFAGPKVSLDWKHSVKGTDNYVQSGSFSNDVADAGTIKFLNAQIVRDQLKFELIAYNDGSTDWYQCFVVSTSENQAHMDDDLANDYKGLKVKLKDGQDNKLALNQRKKFTISIPAPDREATMANIHFGFHFGNVSSSKGCKEVTQNWGINFHKLDWDITPLRAQPAHVSSN